MSRLQQILQQHDTVNKISQLIGNVRGKHRKIFVNGFCSNSFEIISFIIGSTLVFLDKENEQEKLKASEKRAVKNGRILIFFARCFGFTLNFFLPFLVSGSLFIYGFKPFKLF